MTHKIHTRNNSADSVPMSPEVCRMTKYIAGFFFTKKVTQVIGIFPSANFPQEKYFSPSSQFFPQEINIPYVDTKYCYVI